ncbi:MAG: hypothetical protein HP495_02080 [Nitrospira sp.]|jgi:hypothetical protein|nr:hypothetical protein [Nitrospira sp.]
MDSDNLSAGHLVTDEESPQKIRIQTQIHRRRGVKVFSPLTLEWVQTMPASHE